MNNNSPVKPNAVFIQHELFYTIAKNRGKNFAKAIMDIADDTSKALIVPYNFYMELLQKYPVLENPDDSIELKNNIENYLRDNSQTNYPSVSQMVVNLTDSLKIWAKKGFKVVSEEILLQRLNTCKDCEFWDSEALAKTSRCKKCGCFLQAKLRLATEKCPIDKWLPVNPQ